MEEERKEAREQHLLLLIESAQRAGRSEREIGELVEDAVRQGDAERAA